MVKFADLHKNLDDAFNKDFNHGKVNIEHKQAYDGDAMAKGTCTFKISHNPIVGANTSSVECKSTLGSNFFGLSCLEGVVVNEKYSDGLVNLKVEKACSAGSKWTYDFDYDWNKSSCNKANLALDYANANATVGLKLSQSGEGAMCSVPGNVNANVTTAMAGHNLGCNVNYNTGSGAIDHHLKFKLNHGQGYAVVGLKNANDSEVLCSQKVGKDICLGPFGSVKLNDVHVKFNYGMDSGKYGAQMANEGSYNFGDCNANFKQSYDLINGDYKESMKFKVTDSLTANISHKHNPHKGFLKDLQLGASLNFSM